LFSKKDRERPMKVPRTKQELPVSYAVVRFLKHADAVDHYYYHTNFNPFTW
jgi:hypothetical protein